MNIYGHILCISIYVCIFTYIYIIDSYMKMFLSETYLMHEILRYYTMILCYCIHVTTRILNNHILGSAPFDHVPIDYSHLLDGSRSRGFPLFKRCEWLMVNRTHTHSGQTDSSHILYNNVIIIHTI